MDELLEMVCSVFRDFVDGKADSMKLECAVDAYTKIAGAMPVCADVHVCLDGRAAEAPSDVEAQDGDAADDAASEAGVFDSDDVGDIVMPDVMPDTSGDDRGETVSVIVGSKVVEGADEKVEGEVEEEPEAEVEGSDGEPDGEPELGIFGEQTLDDTAI